MNPIELRQFIEKDENLSHKSYAKEINLGLLKECDGSIISRLTEKQLKETYGLSRGFCYELKLVFEE